MYSDIFALIFIAVLCLLAIFLICLIWLYVEEKLLDLQFKRVNLNYFKKCD